MAFINPNYLELAENNLSLKMKSKISEFAKDNPDTKVIDLAMNNDSLPFTSSISKALHEAIDEIIRSEQPKFYVRKQGYRFLKKAISTHYAQRNISLEPNEIFINNGVTNDLSSILDLFDDMNIVMISDPVFPLYKNSAILSGKEIVYINGTHINKFLPMPPIDTTEADLIYLSSPNNITGTVYTREQLEDWVEYALSLNAVILFDASYETFITDSRLPRSIYEIEGAKTCAIEFCNLSKNVSSLDVQCGYTIVPNQLLAQDDDGFDIPLNKLWRKKQLAKSIEVPYLTQKSVAALFTEEGQTEMKANIAYYHENARLIIRTLVQKGLSFYGGIHSPYIWMKCPDNMTSWEYFDYLLESTGIITLPGSEFGKNGEGYVRLSSLAKREDIVEGMRRFIAID